MKKMFIDCANCGTVEFDPTKVYSTVLATETVPGKGLAQGKMITHSLYATSVCPQCKQAHGHAIRYINFKKNPKMHECDARCLNATGRICECACGGANHGKG